MNKHNRENKQESRFTATRILCLVLAGLMILGALTTLFVYIGESLI